MVLNSICSPWRCGASSPVTVYGLHLNMQGSRKFQANGDEQEFPLHTSFSTDRAATSANTDRAQRCIQYAGIAGLENISLIRTSFAEWSSSKNDQDESPRVVRFYVVRRSLEFRSIQQLGNKIGGCMYRAWICRNINLANPRSAIHLARVTGCWYDWFQKTYSDLSTRDRSTIIWGTDRIIVNVQRCWWHTKKGNAERCLHNAKEVAWFLVKFKAGRW